MEDEIKLGIGLWQQIKDINTIPYNGVKRFRDWRLAEKRNRVNFLLDNVTFITGKITLEEYKRITEMINSDDEDNIYMAEQIIIFKANGKDR